MGTLPVAQGLLGFGEGGLDYCAHLLGCLSSLTEPGQVHLRRVRVTRRGDGWLLRDPGNAHWSPTALVPRCSTCHPPASARGLASGV